MSVLTFIILGLWFDAFQYNKVISTMDAIECDIPKVFIAIVF